jgi:hypothetical protein
VIAALFVMADGPYANRPDVDPWPESRDARQYAGPWRVVAHPPCERWGRYWFGGPSCRVRKKLGDDGGCFESALESVERWGGVIEHPEATHAWNHFGITAPPKRGGWVRAGLWRPGWTCSVEQGHYGHAARKATWLYCVTKYGSAPPPLIWGKSGAVRAVGGAAWRQRVRGERAESDVIERMSKRQRAVTPPAFAELMISLARDGT